MDTSISSTWLVLLHLSFLGFSFLDKLTSLNIYESQAHTGLLLDKAPSYSTTLTCFLSHLQHIFPGASITE